MVRKVYTGDGVESSGPYSHAVDAGDYIFFSGQTAKNALNVDSAGDITAQTQQCFENLFSVMRQTGLTSDDVVKVNVYLTTMKNFVPMNEVYQTQFHHPFPARTCVAVLELPLGADVEIEFIAKKPQ